MAAKKLGLNIATQVFDGVTNEDLMRIMEEAEMSPTVNYFAMMVKQVNLLIIL